MRLHLSILATLLASTAAAGADDGPDKWQFQITPYLWLPTISASLNYPPPPDGGGPGVVVGPTDWLDLLNGVALINGGARKGRFSLSADYVYLGLKSEDDVVVSVTDGETLPIEIDLNIGAVTKFNGYSFTLAAGYALQNTERSKLEAIAGARYLGLEFTSDWNLTVDITGPGNGEIILPAEGSLTEEVKLWDGIVGVRGWLAIGDGRWAAPYYFDIGAGDSDLTWQALLGLSYAYSWGDLVLVYRHLEYEGGSEALDELALSGPTFGARFRF
jgi:hypothetical protein